MRDWAAINQAAIEIADFLACGFSEPPIALAHFLDHSKLDYTTGSVKVVDDYLDHVHAASSEWRKSGRMSAAAFGTRSDSEAQTQLQTTIIRCGVYTGEVIRRNGRADLSWWSCKDWIAQYPEAAAIIGDTRDIGVSFILGNETGEAWFPLEKVLKFLESGRADELHALVDAVTSISPHRAVSQ